MRAAAFLVVAALACGLSAVALGAKKPTEATAAPAPEARAAAKLHFNAAQKLFQQDQFADAEREYKAAYEAWPLEGFFFNIAQCERNQGHVDEAILFFERYLGSPKSDEHRAEVEALLVELRARQQALAAPPPPVVAPSPVAAPPAPVSTPSGPVAPSPVAPGTSPASPGAPAITPGPTAPPVTTAGAPGELPPGAMPPVAATEDVPVYRKSWFWFVAGAAVVVVAAGIAVGASSSSSVPSGSLGTADWR